jgi:hypothetical protein
MEHITVTRDQIIYERRVRVLEQAAESGNVAATCRVFGISRKTFYEWRGVADRYGFEALMEKASTTGSGVVTSASLGRPLAAVVTGLVAEPVVEEVFGFATAPPNRAIS